MQPLSGHPPPQPNIYVETVGVARTTCLAYTSMTGGRSNFALCALCAKRTKTEERVRGVKKRKRSWSKPWTADCSSGGLTPAKKRRTRSQRIEKCDKTKRRAGPAQLNSDLHWIPSCGRQSRRSGSASGKSSTTTASSSATST